MPSPSAVAAALAKHQTGLQQGKPGQVTIGATTYDCAVYIGKMETVGRREGGGLIRVQRLVAWIAKTALASKPAARSTVVCDGASYSLNDIYGDSANEASWRLECSRPGK